MPARSQEWLRYVEKKKPRVNAEDFLRALHWQGPERIKIIRKIRHRGTHNVERITEL